MFRAGLVFNKPRLLYRRLRINLHFRLIDNKATFLDNSFVKIFGNKMMYTYKIKILDKEKNFYTLRGEL